MAPVEQVKTINANAENLRALLSTALFAHYKLVGDTCADDLNALVSTVEAWIRERNALLVAASLKSLFSHYIPYFLEILSELINHEQERWMLPPHVCILERRRWKTSAGQSATTASNKSIVATRMCSRRRNCHRQHWTCVAYWGYLFFHG